MWGHARTRKQTQKQKNEQQVYVVNLSVDGENNECKREPRVVVAPEEVAVLVACDRWKIDQRLNLPLTQTEQQNNKTNDHDPRVVHGPHF